MPLLRFSFLFLIALSLTAYGQAPDGPAEGQGPPSGIPMPLEMTVMDEGIGMQLVMNRRFPSTKRLGFFALAEYYGSYDKEGAQRTEYIGQTYLSYDLGAGFSAMGGTAINHINGLRPTVGVQFGRPFKDFFVMVMPRAELSEHSNGEVIGFVEYMPKLTDTWGLYNRVQALYNWRIDSGNHEISYLRLRVGASYKKLRFGAAANFMAFGPMRHTDQLFGGFIGTLIP